MAVSRPCSAILAIGGEMTPPCGVPAGEELPAVEHPGLEPRPDGAAQRREGTEFVQQGRVVDALEAGRDVRVQHVLGGERGLLTVGRDGVVAGPPGAEAVAVRLEAGFPLRFERELGQGLMCSVEEHRNA